VQEKVSTVYLKGDIDTEWAGIPVRGNAGVQYAHTDQASQATAVTNGGRTQVPFADGKKYGDWLPSMNLAFSLPADQTVRVGVARTLARARLDQMRASNNFNLGLTDRRWSGDGGNPRLEPFRANAYDLSWEKYFGVKAYVGLAVFYKDLKSYIYQDNVARDFSGYPNPTNGAVVPISNIGSFNQPINGSGGNIKGFEATLSLPLNLLHPVLDGFGTVASFSDTKSGIKAFGQSSQQPLPGLSRRVSNITAYYEKSGFQARMSQRYRSDFVGEVTGFGADREFRYIKAERVLDAQLGYSFDKGYLKGLSLLFQVNNVNNTPYQTYDAIPLRPNQYTVYGRTYLMGLSYKLQ
jgi:iron complex outermembrane receptor protein